MGRIMRKIGLCVFILVLITSVVLAGGESERARRTVQTEIQNVRGGRSALAGPLSRSSDFGRDLISILKKYPGVGTPKPVLLNGKITKWLVPIIMQKDLIGGFFQLSSDGGTILSYLTWDSSLEPIYQIPRGPWEKATAANEFQDLAELVPIAEQPSAGTPVEPGDLTNLFLIDHLDRIPSKTQEERKKFVDAASLKATLGRRTGSSKCLSYAASMASDWWRIVLGLPIGKYESFVNGTLEYGLNPRLLEALYFQTPASPYTFKKLAGKDRVTGEKIPYSPKHYAYILSWRKPPERIQDPLKGSLIHHIPPGGFGMDRPFFTVFNKTRGTIDQITTALKRHGILYGQHTSRFFKDRVSLKIQGVHSVDIVGTGRLKGKDVVLYYETFGKNHRDYLEDSTFGPRLRAFPVNFIYQGIAFPHQIRVQMRRTQDRLHIQLTDHLGRALQADRLEAWIDGKPQTIARRDAAALEVGPGAAEVVLRFRRKYFQTPEEPELYERRFLVLGQAVVEFQEYEAVVRTLTDHRKRKKGLFDRSRTSLGDFLQSREEQLRRHILQQVKTFRGNHDFLGNLVRIVSRRPALAKSALGKDITALAKFQKLTDN